METQYTLSEIFCFYLLQTIKTNDIIRHLIHKISNTVKREKEEVYTYKEKFIREKRRLKQEIKKIDARLKTLPAGKIICAKNGKRYKWYFSARGKSTYLPKKERQLAERLAEKKYLLLKKEELQAELNAIESYLNNCIKVKNKADKLLIESSGYRELLSENFKILSEELSAWQNEDYQHNESFLEGLKHKTSSGGLVRSKSEVLIDSVLYRNKIPYRYECALTLGNHTIYPDFTIKHPKTAETYYWEHFGAMDDPSYNRNVFNKLDEYNTHGIIPSINLITTYETSEHPLGIDEIENIVERYFL